MQIKRLLICLPLLAVASCSSPEPEQREADVTYTPLPRSEPAPAPVAAIPPANWIDAPRTPGDWRYGTSGTTTMATYRGDDGTVRLSVACDLAARQVRISRPGNATSALPMQIFTETENRTLNAAPAAGDTPQLVATLAPRDPLLDAMAFSRGRFSVDVPGLAPLYLPSWVEVSRVIEDCR